MISSSDVVPVASASISSGTTDIGFGTPASVRPIQAMLGVIIITSYCPTNPCTDMIARVIDSIFEYLAPIPSDTDIVIVMDGYEIHPHARPKKGRITEAMASAYESYGAALHAMCAQRAPVNRISVARPQSHLGFAFAVRWGIELALEKGLRYALVCQHDRCFDHNPFMQLRSVIDTMEENDSIRYVGFPTFSNRNWRSTLQARYHLDALCGPDACVRIAADRQVMLHPLTFWFDSNHLCHCERYLQIYRPFSFIPKEIVDIVGKSFVKKMVLRRGDFIEDRFGQMQRKCFTQMQVDGIPSEVILRSFRWFGSYLFWAPDEASIDLNPSRTFVQHLRGRQTDPVKASAFRALGSHQPDDEDSEDCTKLNIDGEEGEEPDEEPDEVEGPL
jgi:hypothetical protein